MDPRFEQALAQTGPLPLRLKPDGFGGLLEIIISQQVSVASADAIRARMVAAGLTTKAAVLDAGQEGLRNAGLSRPKVRYALLLAAADLDYAGLHALEDAQVITRLTALTGIGPWTAQIYAMFCMGRADIFPAGDLALQVAAQRLFDLPARPASEEMARMAEAWTPWRSVAARALFAYYRILRNREGLG
ncbi:MAG: DNA-3-methyladenine glycosylase 2 family protein [Sulfitobacter sp.]